MKAQLVGWRPVRFNNKDTGEVVEYNELHLVFAKEKVSGMAVAVEKTRTSVSGIQPPCNVELVYDCVPGYNKAVLREVRKV